jgi:uncharacterized protein (DUF1697 family)
MTRYAAFLRAINVGGHVVKMDRLRALCESAGLAQVSTFIASGNVLFESTKPPAQLETLLEGTLKRALGYDVTTMVRSAADVARIVRHVDASAHGDEAGVRLYIGLLKTAPTPAAARNVAALSNDIDILAVHGRELYWRCRKSFSESTVAGPALGRALGVAVTTRNITTVRKLAGKLACN